MRIALIDPYLFSWPYDKELAFGLKTIGHDAVVYGKVVTEGMPGWNDEFLRPHFHKGMGSTHDAASSGLRRILKKGLNHILGMNRLVKALDEWRPDVVHFQWAPLPVADRLFLPMLRRKSMLALTVHDAIPYNGNPGSFIQTLQSRAIMTSFDLLIVHTESTKERLIASGVGDVPISVIPHGILQRPSQLAVTRTIPSTDDSIEILQFGAIKPYKGITTLIRAFALLPSNLRQRCRIVVAGKLHMDPTLLTGLAEELGVSDRIEFIFRFISDNEMAGLFQRASILTFPYREIDTSGVMMAGLEYGLPMIASSIGAFAKLTDGENVRMVPPDDPSELAKALHDVLTDSALRAKLARGAVALWSSIPNWTQIARLSIDAYGSAKRTPVRDFSTQEI
jgi:glycosyltransferase involved in cell wall biosynthesis